MTFGLFRESLACTCSNWAIAPWSKKNGRQNLPTLATAQQAAGVARGGYVIRECTGTPEVLLLATGSEVQLAIAAAESLEASGTRARVISLPCLEWFDAQDAAYRESVLPSSVTARVAVEAGATLRFRHRDAERAERGRAGAKHACDGDQRRGERLRCAAPLLPCC